MIWIEGIRMAFDQIRVNKMRTFLTVLGIIIGIMTVILIVSILDGYRKSIEEEMNRLGANTFTIARYEEGGVQVGEREYRKEFEYWYASEIKRNCDAVSHVGIKSVFWGGQVHYRGESTNPNVFIMGTNSDYPFVGGFDMDEGRFFSDVEAENGRPVAVLGQDIVEKLFPHEPCIGKYIRLGTMKLKVIGTVEKLKNLTVGMSRNNYVMVPYTIFEQLYGKGMDISFLAQARSAEEFDKAVAQTKIYLRKIRHVPAGGEDDFAIVTSEGMINSFNSVADKVRLGGIGMGLISLLVGSIGVMAIMLVSVTERTREIGVRKAIGAKKSIVLFQFIIESIVLTTVGGVIGILVGVALSAAFSAMFSLPMTISTWAIGVSFIVTVVLGVASGLYPAYKASSVDPIEALRYE